MSEPQLPDWEKWIDWSKVDLLDACYDPMLQSMDPSRWVFFLLLANKKGVSVARWTANGVAPAPSSMHIQPNNENENCAIDGRNIANECHDATENTLATMNYGVLPFQQQVGLYQDVAAPVQIPTTSTVVDHK
jgi:hypothetical protein